jgi:predicted CXXCH cytochrome family protein
MSPRNKSTAVVIATLMIFAIVAIIVEIGFSLPERPRHAPPVLSHEAPAKERIAKPPRPDDGYVGSAICSECHAEIAEKYKTSPMANSMAKIENIQLFPSGTEKISFTKGDFQYRVEKKGDRVFHHESLSDQEGVIYDQAEEIQFALGSNTRGQSYLMWRDGAFFVSPIASFTHGDWNLSAGYEPNRNYRFSRPALDGCLMCHCGQLTREGARENYSPEPIFREISIGCERCHGPGKNHVEYRQQISPAGIDPLLNVKDLPPTERDAVCYQCHFFGKERILRYGRTETDFRPGMKLSDIWTVFVNGDGTDGDSTVLVSQAMQMRSSRCFQASEGRMGCVTCHDPHESPAEDRRVSFYNDRCLKCHEQQGCTVPVTQRTAPPADGSCIHCHMASLTAKSVPHSSQTDHRILRRPALPKSSAENLTLTIFQEEGTIIPEIELTRARGLVAGLLAEKHNDRRQATECMTLLHQALATMPDDQVMQLALGGANELLGSDHVAERHWQQIVTQSPRDEDALLRLANLTFKRGRYAEADRYYSRAAEVSSLHVVTLGKWTYSLIQLGRLDDAIKVAERALKLDPSFSPIYKMLADAYATKGDAEKSHHYKVLGDRLSARLAHERTP